MEGNLIRLRSQCLASACVAFVVTLIGAANAIAGTGATDFRFEIRPLLSKNCFACHGPDEAARQGELRLDVRDAPLAAGAFIPGDPEGSELVRRITSDDPEERMPPSETEHRLTAEEINKLKQWIADGAPYTRHWSYEPPLRPELPEVSQRDWCRNEIDFFVLAGLEAAGLKPEPEANRFQLVRRLSLDLTGLPPTEE